MAPCALAINYHLKSEVSITCQLHMLNPFHSITNQELFEKHHCNPRILKESDNAMCPSYRLKSEVSLTLCYWLCSTRYTAV